MTDFIKKIRSEKEFPPQLEVFATIPWELSPNHEQLSIPKDALTDEQREVVVAFEQAGYLQDSKYSSRHSFYPPSAANAERTALWEATFPEAEARLMARLEPLVQLDWQYPQRAGSDYFVWASELTDEQRALVENAPEGSIKNEKSGTLFGGFRREDTQYAVSNFHGDNRLYSMVQEAIEARLAQDAEVLAQLPWQFDRQGNLIVPQDAVAHAPERLQLPSGERYTDRAEIGGIFEQLGIEAKDGKYAIGVPNTVYKPYDGPDGDTDMFRNEVYRRVHDVVLERNKPLLDLPVQFDPQTATFVVTEAAMTEQQQEFAETALARRGRVFVIEDVADYSYRASGADKQVQEFLKKLEAAVPDDFSIGDLGELSWKYSSDGLEVPLEEFLKSEFVLQAHPRPSATREGAVHLDDTTGGVDFTIDYHRNVVIHRNNLDELPYFVAIKRALEERYEQFIAENADAIRALPWSFEVRDNIGDFSVVHLPHAALELAQPELVRALESMNQLQDHIGKYYNLGHNSQLAALLEPQFIETKQVLIAEIAALPWEHSYPGMRLVIAEGTEVTPEQHALLDRNRLFDHQWGGYTIEADRNTRGLGNYGDDAINDLRQAIGEGVRERTPVAELTPEILELPWHYTGKHHGREIALEYAIITDEQKAALLKAIPELHTMDSMELYGDPLGFGDKGKKGYVNLVTPGDEYHLARASMDAPYYEAVQPIAERNLAKLLDEVASFPWRANAEGSYEVTDRELTKEQQLALRKTPDDFFDGEAEGGANKQNNQHSRRINNRAYVLDAEADDSRLVDAIEANERGRKRA